MRDLGRVDVEAEHVVADFGQAGAGDQADVAGADDGDFHGFLISQINKIYSFLIIRPIYRRRPITTKSIENPINRLGII